MDEETVLAEDVLDIPVPPQTREVPAKPTIPPLITDEEAAPYTEEAETLLAEKDLDPEIAEELRAFFLDPTEEQERVAARRDAEMWSSQLFEVQIRQFTAPEKDTEATDKLVELLNYLKEKYAVEPVGPSKETKLRAIAAEIARLQEDMVNLRVRAGSFARISNEQGTKAIVGQIEAITKGVPKLISLRHKLSRATRNEPLPDLLKKRI